MTLPRVRQLGLWTLGSVIEPAEMEEFDQHQFQAIDGYGGGVYAPTVRLVIGGDGVDFTGGTGADPLGPLTSTAAPGSGASGAAVTGDGAGYGISATSTGINPGGFFASTGTGAGCYGLASSGNPGIVGASNQAGQPGGFFFNISTGVGLAAEGGGGSPGVSSVGGATSGAGGHFTGGTVSGPAGIFTGGAPNGDAVQATPTGLGAAVKAIGPIAPSGATGWYANRVTTVTTTGVVSPEAQDVVVITGSPLNITCTDPNTANVGGGPLPVGIRCMFVLPGNPIAGGALCGIKDHTGSTVITSFSPNGSSANANGNFAIIMTYSVAGVIVWCSIGTGSLT